MLNYRTIALVLAAAGPLGAAQAEWKPAAGPLQTRWAKDVSPDRALPEYPRPQLVRKDWQNLNGLWQFAVGEKDQAAPLGKDLDGQILVPFCVESQLSGVGKRAKYVWYRRMVTVPQEWKGRHVMLHFGAVDWEATVYLNGKKLGDHRGGYDAFSFDITDGAEPGKPAELVVGVFDPTSGGPQARGKQVDNPGGIMYTSTTGIWQTVWMEPVAEKGIAELIVVPDVDGACLKLTVVGRAGSDGAAVQAVATDGDKQVAAVEGKVGEQLKLPIADAKLWSPDAPFLYGLKVTLKDGQKLADAVDSYFGMRKIAIATDDKGFRRMMLNGKFVFQIGFLDQGFWPDGIYTAPTDEALRFDIEFTRKLGMNMARKHVKVEPDRWYYWADKLGLLVWQDMPSGDTTKDRKQFQAELTRLVEGRRNHPCIIMWIPFNEGWGQSKDPADTKLHVDMIRKLDPTRLVNEASGWTNHGSGDIIDIHAYPGPGAPKPEKERAHPRPRVEHRPQEELGLSRHGRPGRPDRAIRRTAAEDVRPGEQAGPQRGRVYTDHRRGDRVQRADYLRPGDHQAGPQRRCLRQPGRVPAGPRRQAARADQRGRGDRVAVRHRKARRQLDRRRLRRHVLEGRAGRVRHGRHARIVRPHQVGQQGHLAAADLRAEGRPNGQAPVGRPPRRGRGGLHQRRQGRQPGGIHQRIRHRRHQPRGPQGPQEGQEHLRRPLQADRWRPIHRRGPGRSAPAGEEEVGTRKGVGSRE
jgi:hypothetical protein